MSSSSFIHLNGPEPITVQFSRKKTGFFLINYNPVICAKIQPIE